MRKKAPAGPDSLKQFALGGQDSLLLADQLFAQSKYFCLFEFKYDKNSLDTEARKANRLIPLCKKLQASTKMRKLHDRGHFVAWTGDDGYAMTDIYRHQFCHQVLLGADCGTMSPRVGKTS